MSFEQRQWDEQRQEYFYTKEYMQMKKMKYADGSVERKPFKNFKKVWCGNNAVPIKTGPRIVISDAAREEILGLYNQGKSLNEIERTTTHRKSLVSKVLEEYIAI